MIQIEEQKRKLQKEKEELLKELNDLGYAIHLEDDWIIRMESGEENYDPLDEAERSEEIERKIAELNVLEQRYRKIEKALAAIENGSYGICIICGSVIEEDRLQAEPSAQTCKKHMNEKTAL